MKKVISSLSMIARFFGMVLVLFLFSPLLICTGQVRLTNETVMIPTYIKGSPNLMPRFFEGGAHQGVQRRIYPYTSDNVFSNYKEDRPYNVIHIENDYIDIGIMPSEGGRIYHAQDKTNGYNFIYHNHVIKPSLVGMVGDWRSGSLAWGFPHHHGPNTVKPMDCKITENADSSVTVWISDFDYRHRMKILIGYTFYPNSSLIEMSIHPFNRTPISNSFLFWANPAVIADTTYQVIFPPSVNYVTFHAKRDITTYPIADCEFGGYDFTGLDISMWKNTRVPSSFFSWNPKEDYFGGYNHGQKAGTAWVGNHHICPGMKFWADGNNPDGRKISRTLTDHDGQNIEIMAGMYTDNQPDYSWLQPYESKSGTMIWFPIRELDGLKYANRNGALNLTVTNDNIALVRMNATTVFKQAKVLLKGKEKILFEKSINISPAEPFKTDVPLPGGMVEDDLEVALYDARGGILLLYKPAEHHPPKGERPEPLKPLASPEEISTIEELYLAGLRLNQFYNPAVDPMPYYREALKRDPDDYRVNTQLGILDIKDFKWEEAEKYLRTAVNRITSNYTRPKDCEGLYYLGITLRAQEKLQEAYDYFYQATWGAAWHTPAYYQLAEIDCLQGNYETALDHLNRSISTGTENLRALNLKTIVLRKMKRLAEAGEQAEKTLHVNLIDHQALNELFIISKELGKEKEAASYLVELTGVMRDDVQSYLELATDYNNCGLYREAIDVLSRLERKGNTFPMVYYCMAYYWSKIGDEDNARHYSKLAMTMPHNYCFPFRAEEITVLQYAMQLNPQDPRAPFYLGNLLYEHQPEEAIRAWEISRQNDDQLYIVHRNLGVAYKEVLHDNIKAMTSMEKAIACKNDDPRLLFEYDEICDINKIPSRQKYEFLKRNSKTAYKSSESLLRLATRAVEYGKYNEAATILTSHDIAECEGARERQGTFLNALALRGIEYLKDGKYTKALKDFDTLLTYPLSGKPNCYAQFYYLKGLTYEKTGNTEKAEQYYRKAVTLKIVPRASEREYVYYQGLALKKLGNHEEARQLFQRMLTESQNEKLANLFFTQFDRGHSVDYQMATKHYLVGLAYKGLGETEKARAEFASAIEIIPGHIWSKVHLESLSPSQAKTRWVL